MRCCMQLLSVSFRAMQKFMPSVPSPLIEACNTGSLAIVNLLLAAGAAPYTAGFVRGNRGRTALVLSEFGVVVGILLLLLVFVAVMWHLHASHMWWSHRDPPPFTFRHGEAIRRSRSDFWKAVPRHTHHARWVPYFRWCLCVCVCDALLTMAWQRVQLGNTPAAEARKQGNIETARVIEVRC